MPKKPSRKSLEFYLGTGIALVLAALAAGGVEVDRRLAAVLWIVVCWLAIDGIWHAGMSARWPRAIRGVLSVLVLMIVGAVWWNARPSPDRARLRVQGFEVLPPVAERPIQVNVFFRNIGEAAADVRVFYVSAVRGFPVSAQEQINIETELRDGVEKIVSEGRNIDLRVAPGQGAWYTISGTGVTADWVEKFNKGQLAVSFAGAFFYTDPAGEHSTHFCAYSDTRPQITFICKQGNDEN